MTMTPAEQETLKAIDTARAAGEDPFGDNDQDEQQNAGAADAQTDQAAADDQAGKGAAEEPNLEVLAEIAADKAPELVIDPLSLLNFKSGDQPDYKAVRTELMTAKAKAMKQMMDGEMSAEDFAAEDMRVSEALEDLASQRIRAETLKEVTDQSQGQYQRQVIAAIVATAKDVPYATDATAQRQFDMMLGSLQADPANATKSFAVLAAEAHNLVMTVRGVKTVPAPAPAPAARKADGELPVTLRSLPTAAQSNTGGSITDQLARLRGPEYEMAFAKLTPAQRASMLDE